MLVVVTSPKFIEAEAECLNLFAKTKKVRLHIRKPKSDKKELEQLLEQLDVKTLERAVIHQHHDLIEDFPLGGLHFTEKYRKEHRKKIKYKKRGAAQTISTSFHCLEDIVLTPTSFNYQFLSPVFDSISKKEHYGKQFNVKVLKDKKIIALGGIHVDNIAEAKKLGYDGIAVLGAIWKAKNPVKAFESIHEKYVQKFTK